MRVWEPVEISVNKIDVEDIITTSFGSFDTPPVSGGDESDDDIMGSKRDPN